MIQQAIGFLGAGNMAEALIRGLIQTKSCGPENIFVTDINEIRLAHISKKYGIRALATSREILQHSILVVMAVKPQQIFALLEEAASCWNSERHILISIAAGITTSFIEENTGGSLKVVRVMPNIPARLLTGATGFCLGRLAGEGEALLTRRIFESIGIVVRLEEDLMNAVTALSGSGPAYVFKFCEILISSGMKLGLAEKDAKQLAIQTIFGAAKMLKESGEEPAALRMAVTSPGGTTQAALESLETDKLEEIIFQAMLAARDRGLALQSKEKKMEK